MSYIMVDIESDGPIPGDYSMVSFGAVLIDPQGKLNKTFYAQLKPISDKWIPEALAVSGHTREDTLKFEDPKQAMERFAEWIQQNSIGKPMFISDNNGFDFMFTCWYFHHFTGNCPFGWSSTNLQSLYKGIVKDFRKNCKHLRDTKHTHNPVDDAKGNCEAFLKIVSRNNMKF